VEGERGGGRGGVRQRQTRTDGNTYRVTERRSVLTEGGRQRGGDWGR